MTLFKSRAPKGVLDSEMLVDEENADAFGGYLPLDVSEDTEMDAEESMMENVALVNAVASDHVLDCFTIDGKSHVAKFHVSFKLPKNATRSAVVLKFVGAVEVLAYHKDPRSSQTGS